MIDDPFATPPEEMTRALVEGMLYTWAARDITGTLAYMDERVVHALNVDDELIPYGAATVGKRALRAKLQLVLDQFDFGAYVTDHLTINDTTARARLKIIYIHKPTGARLITRFRMVVTQHAGRIIRIDEYYDAAYLEAFTRYVNGTF